MHNARRLAAALAVTSLTLVACGGSDDDAEVIEAPTTDAAPVEELDDDPFEEVVTEDAPADEAAADDAAADDAPVETAPPVGSAPASDVPVDSAPADDAPSDDGEAVGGAVTASLVEWAIEAPTEYAAGSITFNASNDGSFPHEFVVIRGDGYASLPLEDGGAVIEDELPAGDLIARTSRLGGGSTEELTVDLEPGNYVLVCNLGGGSSSHAGQGQNLDIVVS